MGWGGIAVNDCRWRHCPLLPPSCHCSLYTETIKPLKSCKRVCINLFQSAAAAPSPVMGNMPPNDAMPGGPMPPGFFQVHPALSAATLLTPPSLHDHQHTLTSFLHPIQKHILLFYILALYIINKPEQINSYRIYSKLTYICISVPSLLAIKFGLAQLSFPRLEK